MHYKKAPITEAIIDLRVDWPVSAPTDVFDQLKRRFSDSLPTAKYIHTVEMRAKISDVKEPQFSQTDTIVGVRLDTATPARVVQFQRGGFTYSHMPPYTEWETFVKEAVPLWDAYRSMSGVDTVIRTAVRYINKFRAPVPLGRASDYVKLLPNVPSGCPGETQSYAMQIARKILIAPDSMLVIRCGASEVERDVTEFLLDFDVFINARVEATSGLQWEWLALLRDFKNKMFEEVVTDEARAVFGGGYV